MSGSKWKGNWGRNERGNSNKDVLYRKLTRKKNLYLIAECRIMQKDPYSSS